MTFHVTGPHGLGRFSHCRHLVSCRYEVVISSSRQNVQHQIASCNCTTSSNRLTDTGSFFDDGDTDPITQVLVELSFICSECDVNNAIFLQSTVGGKPSDQRAIVLVRQKVTQSVSQFVCLSVSQPVSQLVLRKVVTTSGKTVTLFFPRIVTGPVTQTTSCQEFFTNTRPSGTMSPWFLSFGQDSTSIALPSLAQPRSGFYLFAVLRLSNKSGCSCPDRLAKAFRSNLDQ